MFAMLTHLSRFLAAPNASLLRHGTGLVADVPPAALAALIRVHVGGVASSLEGHELLMGRRAVGMIGLAGTAEDRERLGNLDDRGTIEA